MRVLLFLAIATPLTAQVTAPSAFQQHKARELLRNHVPCLGCHELDGQGGRSAPSLTTVAARRSAAYIRAIIEDPERVVPGTTMPKTLMSSTARETITRYLARNAVAGNPPPFPSQRVATYSRNMPPSSLYNRWCASCHGHNGSADGPNAKYLPVPPAVHSDAAKMGARSDDALYDVIAGGGAIMGKSVRMPAFGASLSPEEIRSLVGHIRALCSCTGPAWSRGIAP